MTDKKRKLNAVQIRLSEAEREAIDTACKKEGVNLTAWIRSRIEGTAMIDRLEKILSRIEERIA